MAKIHKIGLEHFDNEPEGDFEYETTDETQTCVLCGGTGCVYCGDQGVIHTQQFNIVWRPGKGEGFEKE